MGLMRLATAGGANLADLADLADLNDDLNLVSLTGEALAVARRQEGLGHGHQRVCSALHEGFAG